jgi:signal transduction histidine kinase
VANPDVLQPALSAALDVESTSEAAGLVIEGLVSALGGDAGRILLLNLKHGRFDQRAQTGHTQHPDVSGIAAFGHSVGITDAPQDLLEVAVRSRRSAHWRTGSRTAPSTTHEPSSEHRVVYPVLRGNIPIALLDIEGSSVVDIASLGEQDELAQRIVATIYERRFMLRLLYELQRPTEVNQTRQDFFDELAELIRSATGMEFVAIREHDSEPDSLRCVAAVGLGVERGEFEQLDWVDLEPFPSFRNALEGQTVAEPTTEAEHLAALRDVPHLKDVRSFVALPIVVGETITGVLSVAARCPYIYSRIELRGFETVANAIGVAMANFTNLHANSTEVRRNAELGAGALSDLLAQAARHEAKGHIDNIQKRLYLISNGLESKKSRSELNDAVAKVSEQLRETRDVLEKMRTNALVRPGQTPVRVNLRNLVLSATNMVSGELDAYDITVTRPPDTYVQVIPEAMTLTFLLLIQNSIDAFRSSKAKKRNREIQVSVAARQAGRDGVRITFADNATGIDPARLTIPPEAAGKPWEEAIFERGVSGAGGTGYGLYIVRMLTGLAGGGTPGTIQLIEHRSRVVFALELPAAD